MTSCAEPEKADLSPDWPEWSDWPDWVQWGGHSQQNALRSLQELAAGGVDEDPFLLQGGTSCLGQTAGPGAAAVAADAVAVPADGTRQGNDSDSSVQNILVFLWSKFGS